MHRNRQSHVSGVIGALLAVIGIASMALMPMSANAATDINDGTLSVSISQDSQIKVPLDAYELVKTTKGATADKIGADDAAYVDDKTQSAIESALTSANGKSWFGSASDAVKAVTGSKTKGIAGLIARVAIDAGVKPVATVKVDSPITVRSGLYVMVPHDTTSGTGNSSVPFVTLLDGVQDANITEKETSPTFEKTVGGKQQNVAGMLEDLKYDVHVTLPEDYDVFDKYKITVTDTLSKGLTVDKGSVKVATTGGKELDSSKYSVSTKDGDDGSTVMSVTIDDVKDLVKSLSVADGFDVTYTARLNKDALVGTKMPNENSVTLTYAHSPYDPSQITTTVTKITKTYAMSLQIAKVDADDSQSLKGAKMTLKDTKTGKYWNGEKWADEKSEFAVDGSTTVPAISAGTYELEETKAPNGYDKLSGTATITVTEGIDGESNVTYKVQTSSNGAVSDSDANASGGNVTYNRTQSSGSVIASNVDVENGIATVTVEDNKSKQPSTPSQPSPIIPSPSVMQQTGDAIAKTLAIAGCVAIVAVIVTSVRKHRHD